MSRLVAAARRLAVLALDAAGLALIIYSAWLWSAALGCLVAGVIALGVAALVTPRETGEDQREDEADT